MMDRDITINTGSLHGGYVGGQNNEIIILWE